MLSKIEAKENKVIHSLENPVSTLPGLKIMRGNITPNGAVVRPTAVYEEVKYIKGSAKVFEEIIRPSRPFRTGRSFLAILLSSATKDARERRA